MHGGGVSRLPGTAGPHCVVCEAGPVTPGHQPVSVSRSPPQRPGQGEPAACKVDTSSRNQRAQPGSSSLQIQAIRQRAQNRTADDRVGRANKQPNKKRYFFEDVAEHYRTRREASLNAKVRWHAERPFSDATVASLPMAPYRPGLPNLGQMAPALPSTSPDFLGRLASPPVSGSPGNRGAGGDLFSDSPSAGPPAKSRQVYERPPCSARARQWRCTCPLSPAPFCTFSLIVRQLFNRAGERLGQGFVPCVQRVFKNAHQ
ncbi:hypothetical protein SKAU_G00053950 [Synaphobranchus kaupii]|uniref:Uncharacterized protein n=1 Tax=Synaphobranchus kaupii TaxID=118154 RepID=A0A9Q1G3P6_SYNKA|nr:hypothetical protein SKAU_G00053950 [Synaphobranchus kaupii]